MCRAALHLTPCANSLLSHLAARWAGTGEPVCFLERAAAEQHPGGPGDAAPAGQGARCTRRAPAPPSAAAHLLKTELQVVAGCREAVRRPPRVSAGSEQPVMPAYCPGSTAPCRRMLVM